MAIKDYTGMTFGMLLVLGEAQRTNKDRRVLVRCECGKEKTAKLDNIKNGHTKSCGCLKVSSAALRIKHGYARQGKRGSSLYSIYRDMRTRCENSNYKEFYLYGGRGINVCQRWRNGFIYFLEDMGERPQGMTIERIDVNADYSPSNCKWATQIEQANNKRNSVFLTYNGETLTIAQWSIKLKINAGTLYSRNSKGYSVENILTHKSFITNKESRK